MIRISTLEYLGAFYTAQWGLWLLMGDFTSLDAKAFEQLSRAWIDWFPYVPVHVSLGFAGVLTGVIYAAAIKINGLGMAWTPFVRIACCSFNAVLFASIAWSIHRVDPNSPGVNTYFAVSACFIGLFAANVERVEMAASILWGRIRGRNH